MAQALVDDQKREEFVESIKEEYAEIREEFYAGLEDRRYPKERSQLQLKGAPFHLLPQRETLHLGSEL